MRAATGVLWWVVGVASLTTFAQPVYNTPGLLFDHADADVAATVRYVLEVYRDTDDVTVVAPRYTAQIPVAQVVPTGDVTPDGRTFRLPLSVVPALPVGTTYKMRLRAEGTTGISDPSNLTPQGMRFHPCAASSTGIAPIAVEVPTSWPPLTTNASATIPITITAPSPAQVLTLDLIGDGLPAWTYVLAQTAAPTKQTVPVFLGPLGRAGRYRLDGTLTDSKGCQATVPFGVYVTVAP